jgi:hypothetical protein
MYLQLYKGYITFCLISNIYLSITCIIQLSGMRLNILYSLFLLIVSNTLAEQLNVQDLNNRIYTTSLYNDKASEFMRALSSKTSATPARHTPIPTAAPTISPTPNPTSSPTPAQHTPIPTAAPTISPTPNPTSSPTPAQHTPIPTAAPTLSPTPNPTSSPTPSPTPIPTSSPTPLPTPIPTPNPTLAPTPNPTAAPTLAPTPNPTLAPTPNPTLAPTPNPTAAPTLAPTPNPTLAPTPNPTLAPTPNPTLAPTPNPTAAPTLAPTPNPTLAPTPNPTLVPGLGSTVTLTPITNLNITYKTNEFNLTCSVYYNYNKELRKCILKHKWVEVFTKVIWGLLAISFVMLIFHREFRFFITTIIFITIALYNRYTVHISNEVMYVFTGLVVISGCCMIEKLKCKQKDIERTPIASQEFNNVAPGNVVYMVPQPTQSG